MSSPLWSGKKHNHHYQFHDSCSSVGVASSPFWRHEEPTASSWQHHIRSGMQQLSWESMKASVSTVCLKGQTTTYPP